MSNYKFIEKSFSKERNYVTCYLIDQQLGDDFIDKKYGNSWQQIHTLKQYFEEYCPWALNPELIKMSECSKDIDVQRTLTKNFWRMSPFSRQQMFDGILEEFKKTLEPGMIKPGMVMYATRPKSNWVKNYEILIRSEKTKTLYHFNLLLPTRSEAKQYILKEFNLAGLRSKENKGKTFAQILEDNDLELLIFATDSSRNEK